MNRQRITVDMPQRPSQYIQDVLGDMYGLIPLLIPFLLGWASESWLVFSMTLIFVVLFTLTFVLRLIWRLYRIGKWFCRTIFPKRRMDIRWIG